MGKQQYLKDLIMDCAGDKVMDDKAVYVTGNNAQVVLGGVINNHSVTINAGKLSACDMVKFCGTQGVSEHGK